MKPQKIPLCGRSPQPLCTITPADFAKAIIKQKKLTDSEWERRCDELFEQQRVMFLELATFARDGATTNQYRAIIDFLSELQFLSAGISKAAAAPVGMPEFQEAVKRAVLFFNTLETDDRQDSERMTAAWIDGIMQKSESVIWAGWIFMEALLGDKCPHLSCQMPPQTFVPGISI